ncbi:MAG: DinB family protein [Dehalococcoidia bacterium]
MDKRQQIDAVRNELALLLAATGGLDEAALTIPGIGEWSVREVIAHITGWALLDTRILQRLARGERPLPEGEEYGTGEERNPGYAAEARTKTAAAVIDELRAAFAALIDAAEALPEERFEQGRTAQRIMQSDGSDHMAAHRREIEEFSRRPS